MTFTFFNAAGQVLFARADAEQAEHNHQEMTLYALLPFDAQKTIVQGMRVGYTDNLGVFQTFEIIKCKTYEPDHYQEITAEHICISELTDEIYTAGDIMDATPSEALQAVLSGTLWQVGNVSASNVSSVTLSFGNVWNDIRSIEQNWNVYITPRVTVNATGITGRYLDIAPAEPVWRGLRLALEKNMTDAAVTWDETRVKTALYGFGKKSMTVLGSDEKQPWTFASVTWAATAEHPAKPEGQTYLEDPAATAAFGRNGRPRYGYYQNGDIDDPEKLLELTWETLKTVNVPDVTIEGAVIDLTRFGVLDVPIRLHDLAHVEIRPTRVTLNKEIIQYTENLLQPENSRVTIGTYIPNIVYIQKENARGGGGGSGGQDDEEYQLSEFETELLANNYEISLRAYQRDMDNVEEILRQAGLSIDASGVLVYADDNENMWQSRLNVQADRISLVVTGTGANAAVNAASIVAAVNDSGSTVTISADKIVMDGQTIVTEINGLNARFDGTLSEHIKTKTLQATTAYYFGNNQGNWNTLKIGSILSATYMGVAGISGSSVDFDHYHDITVTESSGVITIETGKASATAVSRNFNIADTAFYQNAVSAARTAGGVMSGPNWSPTITDDNNTYSVTSAGGDSKSQRMTLTQQSSWNNGYKYVYMNADGNQKARLRVNLPSSADSWSYNSTTNVVTCTVGGKAYSTTI